MRTLVGLCLAVALSAGEPALPGQNQTFLAKLLPPTSEVTRPWKTFRVPEGIPSATVEVVGELTPEELRQVTFQEFLAWFREDLRRFWVQHGAAEPAWATASQPVARYGGNPVPGPVPLGRVGF
jgi:hypothetical protein